jgi:hypothetical protein
MQKTNLIYLSVWQAIRDGLDAVGFDEELVPITDTYPESSVKLPLIVLGTAPFDEFGVELGSIRQGLTIRFDIEILARSDAGARDLFDIIRESLRPISTHGDIPIYDYNEGFPEDGISPSKVGVIQTEDITGEEVYDEEVGEIARHQWSVQVVALAILWS